MQSTDVKKDGRVPVYEDQLYPRKVDMECKVVEAFCSSFNTLLRTEDGRCVGAELLYGVVEITSSLSITSLVSTRYPNRNHVATVPLRCG